MPHDTEHMTDMHIPPIPHLAHIPEDTEFAVHMNRVVDAVGKYLSDEDAETVEAAVRREIACIRQRVRTAIDAAGEDLPAEMRTIVEAKAEGLATVLRSIAQEAQRCVMLRNRLLSKYARKH